jgi:RNA polymerase sigma-70 factor (ECF subfamily)
MAMSGPDDDQVLLRAARCGDEDALVVLVDRHRRGLELYCYLMLGDRRRARAAVAETTLAAWDGRGAADAAISPRMWLYRLAIRACADADPGCAISFGADERLTE